MAYIHLTITIKITGAEDRNRTGTVVTYRRILSPVRLPVPPPRHKNEQSQNTTWWALRDSNPRPIGYEPTALTN
jgi:hypothetical protein